MGDAEGIIVHVQLIDGQVLRVNMNEQPDRPVPEDERHAVRLVRWLIHNGEPIWVSVAHGESAPGAWHSPPSTAVLNVKARGKVPS